MVQPTNEQEQLESFTRSAVESCRTQRHFPEPDDYDTRSDENEAVGGWLEFLRNIQSKGVLANTESYLKIRETESLVKQILSNKRPQSSRASSNTGCRSSPGVWSAERRVSALSSAQQRRKAEEIEKDYTHVGVPGRLGCPFMGHSSPEKAMSTKRRHDLPTPVSSRDDVRTTSHCRPRSTRPSFHDPLSRRRSKGEIEVGQEEDALSDANSAQNSAASGPACPIRFLDQHKPEEIAQYFEQHKHELPRSHEVCVKRFQDNSASIRELDAKYGNLVAMIQGLGMKHQSMLPENPKEEEVREVEEAQRGSEASKQRIQNWAKAVSESNVAAAGSTSAFAGQQPHRTTENENDPASPSHVQDDVAASQSAEEKPSFDLHSADIEERVPHFARPLKDVRVGESPSRPWGVPVPSKYQGRSKTESEYIFPNEETPAPVNASIGKDDAGSDEYKPKDQTTSPGQCPFHKQAPGDQSEQRQDTQDFPRGQGNQDTSSSIGSVPVSKSDRTQHLHTDMEPGSGIRQHVSSHNPRNQFVNYGTVVIAGNNRLDGNEFTNHGTMLIGYSLGNKDLHRLLRKLDSKDSDLA